MKNQTHYNALYCCCIADPWLDTVKALDKKLNISPAYYIGWEADHSHQITDSYPNCFFQTVEDAWRGKGFPKLDYQFDFNEETIKSISFEKNIAINMMDRLDLSRRNFTSVNKELYFNQLLKYWITIVEYYKIDIIIAPSIPHRIFDYILYIVAKIKHIEIVMFQMTHFPDSSILIQDIHATPTYLKNYLSKHPNPSTPLREDIQRNLEKVQQEYHVAIPTYMKEHQKAMDGQKLIQNMKHRVKNFLDHPLDQFQKDDTYYIITKDGLPHKKTNLTYQRKIQTYKNIAYLKRLKASYQKISVQPDFTKKYLFVALHYQPEENSVPSGGVFGDQSLIIELLNSFLSDEYTIYIKEHKVQFHSREEGALGRSPHYYHAINNISPRVQFVDIESDPFEMIDHAIATVSIGGTIGWEGIVRGTPALLFGRGWYEDMPGAFKIKSAEALKTYWTQILNSKNNISKTSIESYHKNLQHFFVDAHHYKFFKKKNPRPIQESVHNLLNGLENHLNQINFFNNRPKES